ncbi:MAG: HpcH/HpaI aldolase/citrate lyase family protein, partial [Thiovulaceae bacterium]|nr:HpcH/HpaI aldolase/citrate lyase family protein [Sulfurimonadaceae bacterium]
MREAIHALELGGTLFVPASHKDLASILSGEKHPALRSVFIDFEDGLADADRAEAQNNLPGTLAAIKENKLLRFIRPQDPKMLEHFMQLRDINKIDGFILPKFGLNNANEYLSIIQHSTFKIHNYKVMPSIEGEELFDTQKLRQLRDILLP